MKMVVVHNGFRIPFDSMDEICRVLGLSQDRVKSYMTLNNCDCERAVEKILEVDTMNSSFTYNETPYNSMYECCKRLGIEPSTLIGYSKKNLCSYSEAFDYFTGNKTNHEITYKGRKYGSFKELCDDFSIDYPAIQEYRGATGSTIEEALQCFITDRKKPRSIVVEGKQFASISDCLESHNLNYTDVAIYRKRKKCSYEKAIEHFLEGAETSEFES